MSFSLIGSDFAVGGSSQTTTTDANTLIGDLLILRMARDGGSFSITPPAGFAEITDEISHASDTLGTWAWWAVADANGETDYTINASSSSKSTLTVYRNTIGGGTWGLGNVSTSNTDTGGSFTLGGVTSINDSLLLFSSSHDDDAAVNTPPSSMTAAAPNPVGGDTIGLYSYFEDITSGAAESRTIVYAGNDAIIGTLSVHTYTIAGGGGIQILRRRIEGY